MGSKILFLLYPNAPNILAVFGLLNMGYSFVAQAFAHAAPSLWDGFLCLSIV
jgi:hypothetical protein